LVLAGVYVGALRSVQVAPARPAVPSPAEDGRRRRPPAGPTLSS
jgi:hypothetical protein